MSAPAQDIFSRMHVRRDMMPSTIVWLLLAMCTAVFWSTFVALGRIWLTVADYQHGFVIAAISLVWLYKSRAHIDACDADRDRRALPILVALVALWTVGNRANSEILQQIAVPSIMLSAVHAAAGARVTRQVAMPVAYLYFAVPFWDHFIPILQWVTTHVAETVLGILGVPTQVEGHFVTIPEGQFSIVDGCSGKRYLLMGLPFAVLVGALEHVRGRRLALLLIATVIAALITNWLRVVTVIYAGHVSDMQHYFVAVEHKSLGYAVYIPMLAVIVFVARKLARGAEVQPAPVQMPYGASVRPRLANVVWPAIILLMPVTLLVRGASHDLTEVSLASLPVMTGTIQGPLPADNDWRPAYASASHELRASYIGLGTRIEIYLNSYGLQSPGRELVYHSNSVAPADRWTTIDRLPVQGDEPAMIVASHAVSGRWVIGQMYKVGGYRTVKPAVAQLFYGLSSIWHPTPSGVAAVAVPCKPDCSEAASAIREFWGAGGDQLLDLIPNTY